MKKLHLGCGPDKRKGWINVDINPSVKPDIVSRADKLPMIQSGTIDVIESCHMFEHFTYHQAIAALTEWHRVLKRGGKLMLELPNIENCFKMLGKHKANKGFDLGMVGIYGHPPMVKSDGLFQTHKWGWTPETLKAELKKAGFYRIKKVPITQTWRLAAKTDRDMRLESIKEK